MFELPELDYGYDALEPTVSARALRLHHDKHQAGYYDALNARLGGPDIPQPALEALITASNTTKDRALFNCSSQAWNHAFFFASLAAEPSRPSNELAECIAATFGELDECKDALVRAGVGQFGSGWVWLAADASGALQIIATQDAHNLISRKGLTPLLVCDVWEHAYYLEFQNLRKAYLEKWFDLLINWPFAERQYAAALGKGAPWRHPAPVPASLESTE